MVQAAKNSASYVACILGLVAPWAFAGEWTASASVAPQVVYTDNVCLSADDEEGDGYAVITPTGSIRGSGNRANVSLSTSVDVNSLTNGSLERKGCGSGLRDRDQYLPQLNASADAILVEQWLFIDADVTASQNEVSPFAAGGDDRADRLGNTNTTYRYSVSPYIARRFKNTADLLLRYTYDDQYNSKDIVGDSGQESWLFTLGSGPVFSPLSWSLQGDYLKTEYSDTPGREVNNNSELKSAQLNLGYQLNRTWQINGFYGDEWNDFVSSNDDIDGSFWGAGLRWTPTVRTSVDAGTGDRFFGSTPWLHISHRHKRNVFTTDYEKTLTYERDIRTLDDGLPGSDGPGQPTTLGNSPILDERFSLGYSYQGRRSRLGISASRSEQTRREDGEESVFKRISVFLNHSLSRNLSVTGGLSWTEDDPRREGNQIFPESETWRATLSARRPISTNTSLSVRYVYTDRQSDLPIDEYTENRISLTIRFNLI